MLLYILLIIFIAMLIFFYIKLEKDIMQPPVIFCAVYVFSIICAILNIDKWNIIFRNNTFLVLVLGGIEFVCICYAIHKLYNRKEKAIESKETCTKVENSKTESKITIKKYMVVLVCIYDIVILSLLLYNVLSIASQFGEFSNFTEALTLFKNNTSYNVNAEIPHYMNLLGKPVIIFAYIFLYIFLKNILVQEGKWYKKIFKNSYYLIPVFTYICYEFASSNRLTILSLAIGGFTMAMIILNQANNWQKIIKLKTIGKMILVAICGLIMFYFSASFVGRVNSKGLVDYITLYCGGSLECFNRFMQDSPEESDIIGKETFYYLIKNLDSYGIIDLENPYPIHLEFRYGNGEMIGNVYTAYRRWIYDFGIIGMVILQAIMAIFYQTFYEKIKKLSKQGKDTSFLTILYGYMSYPLFLHPIDGYLYLLTIRLAFITTLIMYSLAYIILLKLQIKKEKNVLKINIGEKSFNFNYHLKKNREKEKIHEEK